LSANCVINRTKVSWVLFCAYFEYTQESLFTLIVNSFLNLTQLSIQCILKGVATSGQAVVVVSGGKSSGEWTIISGDE